MFNFPFRINKSVNTFNFRRERERTENENEKNFK